MIECDGPVSTGPDGPRDGWIVQWLDGAVVQDVIRARFFYERGEADNFATELLAKGYAVVDPLRASSW